MESGTIAAQGYRFRVPYGTLLCVSDKPLHGEIELAGAANAFYDRAVSEHLMIGLAIHWIACAVNSPSFTPESYAVLMNRHLGKHKKPSG